MATKVQHRRDTALNWAINNPILNVGEIGFDTTNKLFKMGDGVSDWETLGEFNPGSMIHMGNWDASTGSYPTSPEKGWYYIISVNGTISGTPYAINDWIVYNGSSWNKVDNQSGGVSQATAIALSIALG